MKPDLLRLMHLYYYPKSRHVAEEKGSSFVSRQNEVRLLWSRLLVTMRRQREGKMVAFGLGRACIGETDHCFLLLRSCSGPLLLIHLQNSKLA
jgi:hypothetical protein